jgi:hypothetical protein
MKPIEKLEIIVRGELRDHKLERKRAIATHGRIYIQELDNHISMLDWVLGQIGMIKRNAYPVSDDLVIRMYGPIKTE